MATKVKAKTSAVVSRQVPEFVREDHPQFIAFLEAYYEWLDTNYDPRKLDAIMSLDESVDEYVEYFADQFMALMPKTMQADKRLVLQYAKDMYDAKGTPKSFDLLFRIMFNEEPQEIYYPKVDILKVSDGKWEETLIIRGYDVQGDSFNLIGQTITQANPIPGEPESYALVESVVKYNVGIELVTEINLSANGLFGDFLTGIPIYGVDNNSGTIIRVDPISFIAEVDIAKEGSLYETGDQISIEEQNIEGVDFRASISTITSGEIHDVVVVDGGNDHYVNQPIVFDNTDAGFDNTSKVDSAKAIVSDIVTGWFVSEDYVRWAPSANVVTGNYLNFEGRKYRVNTDGQTGIEGPTHIRGTQGNGGVTLTYVGKSDQKLLAEDEAALELEYKRYYKTDSSGNYQEYITPFYVETGPIKSIRLIYGGKHYVKLPRVLPITDNVTEIKTVAGSNVVTVVTSIEHEMEPGEKFVLNGTINQIADGTYSVFETPNAFTITFRSETIFSQGGSLTLPNRKQYLYSEKVLTDNLIRKPSTAVLLPVSNNIGRAKALSISNFGYFYETARLSLPVRLVASKFSAPFVFGETVTTLPQTFATEVEDEFLLEDGSSFLLEQQWQPKGKVKFFDIPKGILYLEDATSESNITLENGGFFLSEQGLPFSNENSHIFTNRATVVGDTSEALCQIVYVNQGTLKETLSSFGKTAGKFLNSDGKVSDGSKKIQDSFFYQDFSYVLRVGASVSKYRDAVKKLLHPAGLQMFGEVNLVTAVSALIDMLQGRTAILTNIIDIQTKASMLAIGNWQEETYRIAMDNQDRPTSLKMEGGVITRYVLENGIDELVTEDGKKFVSEDSWPDGRILLKEDGYKFWKEEQVSAFFPENLLGETYNFFRLESDNIHTKSRNPDLRKEMWVVKLEDFLPSAIEADLPLMLENGTGQILLEDGFRFLNEVQTIKSAPSVRVLQSEMLPPVIIPEMPLNTIHMLEMSPEVFKETVFNIKTKTGMHHQQGYISLEDGTGILLDEVGNKLYAGGDTILVAEEAAYRVTIESQPGNVELDHLLLETGYQLLRQPDYPDGFSRVVTIDPVNAGAIDISGAVFAFDSSAPIFVGHIIRPGVQVALNNPWQFNSGVVTSVTESNGKYLFTARLDEPVPESRPETDAVSITWAMPPSKLLKDDQSQAIYRTNFRTQVLPVKTLRDDGEIEVYSSKFTTQTRPSFKPLNTSLTMLEQRKFGFAPYTAYNAKGSLQVYPGTVPPPTKLWASVATQGASDWSLSGIKVGDVLLTNNNSEMWIVESLTGSSPWTWDSTEPQRSNYERYVASDLTLRYHGPNTATEVVTTTVSGTFANGYLAYQRDLFGEVLLLTADSTSSEWQHIETLKVGDAGIIYDRNSQQSYSFTVLEEADSDQMKIDAPTMTGTPSSFDIDVTTFVITNTVPESTTGFTGVWNQQYPAPNRDYWNNDSLLMEDGDELILETGDQLLNELGTGAFANTQIKDFANVTVYDVINRKYKKANFAVGAYVEILKSA